MIRRLPPMLVALTGVAAAACASGPDVPAGPPNYSAVATLPPSPRARLYADCVAASVAAGTYAHAQNHDTDMVVFTCDGRPARAFYEGLAERSAAVGSQFVHDGRTWRSTNRVERDLFGVDVCSTDGAADFRCSISLNAGPFLRESAD
jgi:hypothetical protein